MERDLQLKTYLKSLSNTGMYIHYVESAELWCVYLPLFSPDEGDATAFVTALDVALVWSLTKFHSMCLITCTHNSSPISPALKSYYINIVNVSRDRLCIRFEVTDSELCTLLCLAQACGLSLAQQQLNCEKKKKKKQAECFYSLSCNIGSVMRISLT